MLVENKRNLDLRNALQLVADVQPVEVGSHVLNEVLCVTFSSFSASFVVSSYDIPALFIHQVHFFVTRRLEQLLVCFASDFCFC